LEKYVKTLKCAKPA